MINLLFDPYFPKNWFGTSCNKKELIKADSRVLKFFKLEKKLRKIGIYNCIVKLNEDDSLEALREDIPYLRLSETEISLTCEKYPISLHAVCRLVRIGGEDENIIRYKVREVELLDLIALILEGKSSHIFLCEAHRGQLNEFGF